MKRCPQCNRVENDGTLAFCRADGTPLVSDSGSVSADAGTVKFGSAPVVSEIETSILPQTVTHADMSRPKIVNFLTTDRLLENVRSDPLLCAE